MVSKFSQVENYQEELIRYHDWKKCPEWMLRVGMLNGLDLVLTWMSPSQKVGSEKQRGRFGCQTPHNPRQDMMPASTQGSMKWTLNWVWSFKQALDLNWNWAGFFFFLQSYINSDTVIGPNFTAGGGGLVGKAFPCIDKIMDPRMPKTASGYCTGGGRGIRFQESDELSLQVVRCEHLLK